jgi:uncharacterized protein (TIGR04222 family)
MSFLAAAGDTWGISDPVFAIGYSAVLVLPAGFILYAWIAALTLRPDPAVAPTPADVALLTGDRPRVLHATLAGLWSAEVIAVDDEGHLHATGPLPADASNVDRVVRDAVADGRDSFLSLDTRVIDARAELDQRATRLHWRLSPTLVKVAEWTSIPLILLAVLGAVRVGMTDPSRLLIGLAATALAIGLAAMWMPWRTLAGRRLLARVRRESAHLDPQQSSSWAELGWQATALSVALYGATALVDADPDFALAAGIAQTPSGVSSGDLAVAAGDVATGLTHLPHL